MVSLQELRPGMMVKIVDRWNPSCNRNSDGHMDKYLGKVVTILEVNNSYVLIDEDTGDGPRHQNGHWRWNANCIDCIVQGEREFDDFEPSTENEILSLILGG